MDNKKQIISRPITKERIKLPNLNYIRLDLDIGFEFMIPKDGVFWTVEDISNERLTLSRKISELEMVKKTKPNSNKFIEVLSWKEFWERMSKQ